VVGLFTAPMRDLVGVLEARIRQLEEQGEAVPEPEPAAEEPAAESEEAPEAEEQSEEPSAEAEQASAEPEEEQQDG